MSIVQVKVPDIGDFKEVEIIELLVKPGDTVKVDQSLITVESDKASMEIPSSHAGVVKEIKVKVGEKVAEGSVILMLEGAAAATGHVNEPFLAMTPHPEYLLPAYYSGRNLAESYYMSIRALSWQNIVIGDPLTSLGPPAH